jgi:hypothetical protein
VEAPTHDITATQEKLAASSDVPKVDISRKGLWELPQDYSTVNTHINWTLDDVHARLQKFRKSLDDTEDALLELLTHWYGWLPTAVSHEEDFWVKYIRQDYNLPDLVVLFDSLTWLEDLDQLPPSLPLRLPTFF